MNICPNMEEAMNIDSEENGNSSSRGKKKSYAESHHDMDDFEKVVLNYLTKLHISKNYKESNVLLGSGAFGTVKKWKVKEGKSPTICDDIHGELRQIAVKEFSEEERGAFFKESKVLKDIIIMTRNCE